MEKWSILRIEVVCLAFWTTQKRFFNFFSSKTDLSYILKEYIFFCFNWSFFHLETAYILHQ
jgi:hypothetical protein